MAESYVWDDTTNRLIDVTPQYSIDVRALGRMGVRLEFGDDIRRIKVCQCFVDSLPDSCQRYFDVTYPNQNGEKA